jgi:hypothetical protein
MDYERQQFPFCLDRASYLNRQEIDFLAHCFRPLEWTPEVQHSSSG